MAGIGIFAVLARLGDLEDDEGESGSAPARNQIAQGRANQPRPAKIWARRGASLLAFARLHRTMKVQARRVPEADSLIDRLNEKLAIRNSDLQGPERQKACKGKGKYKSWTAAAMLRCTFGMPTSLPPRSDLKSHKPKPSPCQFSTSSTAFWFQSATNHVQRVRNAICNLYMQMQRTSIGAVRDAPMHFKKLHLEWDETGQLMRLRTAMLEKVRGVFPVCIQRWTCSWVLADGMSWLHEPVIVPPAVLSGSTAAELWAAMNAKGPLKVFEIFGGCRFGLLYLMSDRCNTNLCLINHCIRTRPPHVAVASHACNLHETHHGSKAVFLRQGYVSVMFCASNVLRSGPVYRDLLQSVRTAMRKRFRVRFTDPDPRWKSYAEDVLRMTYLNNVETGDFSELQLSQRRHKAAELLQYLNGDWRSTWVTHHCRLGCCRNAKEPLNPSLEPLRP